MPSARTLPRGRMRFSVARPTNARSQELELMADMNHRRERIRGWVAASAFATALILIAWLPLGVLKIVPFVISLPGTDPLRAHAGAAIACLLVAALGFWRP